MTIVHTAQLNVGKKLKYSNNVYFMDVTVKSGDTVIKNSVAPKWELLAARKLWEREGDKAPCCDDETYSSAYLLSLARISTEFEILIQMLDSNEFDSLVLGCYCGKGKFCHRHLLQRHIVEKYPGLTMGWEIVNDDVTTTPLTLPVMYSIEATDDVCDAIKANYADDEACFIIDDPALVLHIQDIALADLHPDSVIISQAITMQLYIHRASLYLKDNPDEYIIDLTGLLNGYRSAPKYIHMVVPETLQAAKDVIDNTAYTDHTIITRSIEEPEFEEYMDALYTHCTEKNHEQERDQSR